MVKFTKFLIIMLFSFAIHSIVFGHGMTKKEENHVLGYRTVHLVNLKSVDDEAEIVAIADDFNNVVAELGYQNICFKFWKETGELEGQYKYIFESTWPDKETYDKVHEYEKFKVVWEKSYAKWIKMIEEDIYNKYIPLN